MNPFFKLPVLPNDIDDAGETYTIQDAYLAELNLIDSTDALSQFISRWSALWELEVDANIKAEIEKLTSLNFDLQLVFGLLLKRDDDEVGRQLLNDENIRIMSHLAIPMALLRALSLAKEYGVTTDLAMIRLYIDSYDPDDRERFAAAKLLLDTKAALNAGKLKRVLL